VLDSIGGRGIGRVGRTGCKRGGWLAYTSRSMADVLLLTLAGD
jgi:hypothetical protein